MDNNFSRFEYEVEAYKNCKADDQYYFLRTLPVLAFLAGEPELAVEYANSLLSNITDRNSEHDNFFDHSNETHIAYTVLGKVACSSGDTEKAKEYLKKSASIRSNYPFPNLSPSMSLAEDLLNLDEKLAVKEYLKNCIFQSLTGQIRIGKWFFQMCIGKKPDFGIHAELKPDYSFS